MKKILHNKKLAWGLILGGIILLVIGVTQYRKTKNRSEGEILMAKIAEFMLLPDEVPRVATVIDKSKLGEQKFFKNALVGDKVLIFLAANQAILYRPSIDKVVEKTSILEVGQLEVEVTPSIKEEIKIKVVIYNGSRRAGLAAKFQTEILDKIDSFEVIAKKDAKAVYPKSLVIDVSGNFDQVAQSMAQSIGGEVSPLPQGEIGAEADILVIVGENWP